MQYLILSDIHANWEALAAVLEQVAGRYDRVLCCGDLVGYCADPNAVVEWVIKNVSAVVRGNHDKAAADIVDLDWFNPSARMATFWTRKSLTAESLDYLRGMPKGPLPVEHFQLVHGSPLDEDEYITGLSEVWQIFDYLDKDLTFFGHSHIQGGFYRGWGRVDRIRKTDPKSDSFVLKLSDGVTYYLNPGSVGQPRDGDARAAYVLYESEERVATFARCPYDYSRTQVKIREAGLPDILADRLASGR